MSIYSQISANKRKSRIIILLFIIFIGTLAYIFGEASGYAVTYAGIGIMFSGIMSFSSYYFSDSIILAMSGAKHIQKQDSPLLFRTVENLCIASGLPMPRIYIINDSAPNAFATGRDPKHSVVCATTGLLEKLNKVELEGVIAHELSHIANYDIRLMSIVVIMVGIVTLLSDFFLRSMRYMGHSRERKGGGLALVFLLLGLLLALISPIIASFIQLAVSRKREFLADASGALITRYPEGLASALEKLAKDREPLEVANNGTAHLFIVNPFKDKNIKGWFAGLFNTHPPIEERVRILRSM